MGCALHYGGCVTPDEILAHLKASMPYCVMQCSAARGAAEVKVNLHRQQLNHYVGLAIPVQVLQKYTMCSSVQPTLQQCEARIAGPGPLVA